MSFPFNSSPHGPPPPRQTMFEAFAELGWGVSFGIATSAAGMLVLIGWLIWWLLS